MLAYRRGTVWEKTYMMAKNDVILVTGASGMIGSTLCKHLRADGYTKILAPEHASLELRDQAAVDAYFAHHRPRYVFHLAARVGGIHANSEHPAQFIYDNTLMQSLMFAAAQKYGVEKILFPGSACTYPKMAPQPVIEAALGSGPMEPTNIAYGTAKMNGIVMAQSYAREYGLKVIVPMPTNTYGAGDNFRPEASHVIPALMLRMHEARLSGASEVVLWGSGSPLREFIFTDDVADAFVFLMNTYDSADIINLGTMQEISIKALAGEIQKTVGYKGKLGFDASKPDGAPRKILDSSKLRALGWQPKVTLTEGLSRMYAAHFG